MTTDEEIEEYIKTREDPEELRQSLYQLKFLENRRRAFDLAVEYMHYPNWMVKRNAIIVLGQLGDKKAVPLLIDIIHKGFSETKLVQYGDKGDSYGTAVDEHIIRACIDSIWQCGPTPEVASLSKYDNLTVPDHEALISEVKRLVQSQDTELHLDDSVNTTVEANAWNLPARFENERERRVVDPVDYYSIPGTHEVVHPSKPPLTPIRSTVVPSYVEDRPTSEAQVDMTPDEELEEYIRTRDDPEELRQSLYQLKLLQNQQRAVEIAIEYTRHENWMIRRNAIMILGELGGKQAVPLLVDIIHKELSDTKFVQYGEKSCDYGVAVDEHIIRACINSIWECGPTSEVASLSKYDKLSVPGHDSLIDEIKGLAETHETRPQSNHVVNIAVRPDAWCRPNPPIRGGSEHERRVVDPVDFYSIPGTQEMVHPLNPPLTPILTTTLPSHVDNGSTSDPPPGPPVIAGVFLLLMAILVIIAVLYLAIGGNGQQNALANSDKPTITTTMLPAPTQLPASQIAYGDVSGNVYNKAKPEGHATISYTLTGVVGKSVPMSVTADNNGYYSITHIQYGTYSLIVWDGGANGIMGYKTITINSSTMTADLRF